MNLLSYFLAMFSSAFIMVSFAAIAPDVAKIYECPEFEVNFMVITFLMAYVFVNFPAVIALEKGDTVGRGVFICVSLKVYLTSV